MAIELPAHLKTVQHASQFERQILPHPVGTGKVVVERFLDTVAEECREEKLGRIVTLLPRRILAEIRLHFRDLFETLLSTDTLDPFSRSELLIGIADELAKTHGTIAAEMALDSVKGLRALIGSDKEDTELIAKCRYKLAQAFGIRGKVSQAIVELKKLARESRNTPDACVHFQLGTLYRRRMKKGDEDISLQHFLKCIEINPDFQDAYLKASQAYEHAGDIGAAIDILQSLEKSQGPEKINAILLNEIGVLYRNRWQKEEEDKECLAQEIEILCSQMNMEQTNELFRKLLTSYAELLDRYEHKNGPFTHDEKGKRIPLRMRRNENECRIIEIEQFLLDHLPPTHQLEGSDHGAVIRKYELMMDIHRKRKLRPHDLYEAVNYYHKAADHSIPYLPSLTNLAWAYVLLERNNKALAAHQKAVEKGLAKAHFHLARFYVMETEYLDFEKALSSMNEFLKIVTNNPEEGVGIDVSQAKVFQEKLLEDVRAMQKKAREKE